jgi:glutamate formiminotransferase/formiminotetrahydrofolate cyclodeaminase
MKNNEPKNKQAGAESDGVGEPVVECVPNFSEGSDPAVFDALTAAIESVEGVRFLGLEPDASYNRVVVTFAGAPDAVVEAAVRCARVAAEKIDMTKHQGGHPRFGAMDVCPFVPVRGVSLADCAELARSFGRRVGEELELPVYLYEMAASRPERKNLARVRAGEYEALPEKIEQPEHAPDFGPARFVPRFGAVAAGARFFLVAYNIDLDTEDLEAVNEIAFAVRELGTTVSTPGGGSRRVPGKLRFTKGIGVAIPERRMCQVSMNLTHYLITPPHVAFEEVRFEARRRGIEVTGSEVVGLVPVEPLLMAAEYHLFEQGERPPEVTRRELVQVAHDYLGLSDFNPFDIDRKVIEYAIA